MTYGDPVKLLDPDHRWLTLAGLVLLPGLYFKPLLIIPVVIIWVGLVSL